MLSDAQIAKFQELHLKRFGTPINREEAIVRGEPLMNLMRLIYRPITIEDYQSFLKCELPMPKSRDIRAS